MKRHLFSIVMCAVLLVPGLYLHAQTWVATYGLDTQYRPPRYLSGYGSSDLRDLNERLRAARTDALTSLSRQVRTRITSSEDIRVVDDGRGTSSRYTSSIQTATDLRITGAQYEVAEYRGRTHVLAWIRLDDLRVQFLGTCVEARDRLIAALDAFTDAADQGEIDGAERALGRAESALSALHDAATVVRALDALAGRSTREMRDSAGTVIDPLGLERLVIGKRESLSRFQPADPRQAADVLARTIVAQAGVHDSGGHTREVRGIVQVMPLLYQDADFSSSFGSRMAGLVSSAIARIGTGTDTSVLDTVVIRGSYWPEDDRVEVQLTARSIESGHVVAAAHTTIPITAVDAATLAPANADVALTGTNALLNDQVVTGGLELDVWTDRGRNESALVFEEGDVIQFYFRVNQPAFLQLSYVLASGDTVLLEERFYIGVDRVNRVVALPYRFQVVPPFGVERLIVTAHSDEPPRPDVIPRQISGQPYQVFRSPGDAVVRTRGLVREQTEQTGESPAQTRVGEAHLTITTIARDR